MKAAVDDLLAHAGWLSGLARDLVRGDVADDVVQETWVAALRTPPEPGRPPRPWLASVLRNFVRQRARADGRRRRHEEATAVGAPAAAGAADQLYQRVDLQRALAAQVMALD